MAGDGGDDLGQRKVDSDYDSSTAAFHPAHLGGQGSGCAHLARTDPACVLGGEACA